MERQEMLKWKKAAWQKLMGAIAMLLVASIMMSATSYAWFVLSTAPEVTDLTTTAGANGALEIALQSNKADGTGRADILSGVGQSIASKDAQTANAYWGNVVDLSKGYGLEHITLYPARLNLNGGVVNTTSMLSIPTFGTDGRVTSLKNAEKTYYKDGKFERGQSHWGVNVMGATSNEVGDAETITLTYNRDFVLNEARTKVAEYRTSLREQMTKTIEDNSVGLMFWMMKIGDGDLTVGDDEEATVKNYIDATEGIVDKAVSALQWALMANAAADSNIKSESKEDMVALGQLYAMCQQLPPLTEKEGTDSIYSVADKFSQAATGETKQCYEQIKDAATAIANARQRVYNAREDLKDGAASAGAALVNPTELFGYGSDKDNKTVEALYTALKYDFGKDGRENETIFATVKTSLDAANLFSAIAKVLGDYSGMMNLWVTMDGEFTNEKPQDEAGIILEYHYEIKATSQNDWEAWSSTDNVGTLGLVAEQINNISAPGTIRVQLTRSDLSAYGYSVDLALKCSKDTELQLQQDGIVRVGSDGSGTEDVAADTMGGGSTMVFDLAGDLTETQVRKLMQGIYVVLLDTDSGRIYKIAAVDMNKLTVDQLQYPNRATGTLALYEPTIKDGVLSLGDKATSITRMNADTQLNLTALVFLNGDQVDASMFSGTQALSLTGTLNLQFASSEALTAMEYTDYAPEKTTDNP